MGGPSRLLGFAIDYIYCYGNAWNLITRALLRYAPRDYGGPYPLSSYVLFLFSNQMWGPLPLFLVSFKR